MIFSGLVITLRRCTPPYARLLVCLPQAIASHWIVVDIITDIRILYTTARSFNKIKKW